MTGFGRSIARGLVRTAQQVRAQRWRLPPPISFGERAAGKPTIFYLSPDPTSPAGGVRVIYRHVDILNESGIPAAVVHTKPGFRCEWFANETRVVSADRVVAAPDDILVVPEFFGPALKRLPDEAAVVVLNQGAYRTFDLIPFSSTEAGAPYASIRRLVGMLCVSEDNANLLRHAFPSIPIHLARPAIDPAVFSPGSGRSRRITYLTHRRQSDRESLLHILRSRGALDGWELVPIVDRTELETADIMRSSAIFLSFSDQDGFGLPPAEAMACGAYVVGYSGMGGTEFFDPEYCSPVESGNLLAFAVAVEDAIARFNSDPPSLIKLGRIAAERILARYSREGLRGDLVTFFGGVRAPASESL